MTCFWEGQFLLAVLQLEHLGRKILSGARSLLVSLQLKCPRLTALSPLRSQVAFKISFLNLKLPFDFIFDHFSFVFFNIKNHLT